MPAVSFYLADQNPQRDKSLGISGYTLGLWQALRRSGKIQVRGLASRSSICPDASCRRLPLRSDQAAWRLLVDQLHSPLLPPAEIYHYPKGFLPRLLPVRRPVVATVHDTIIQFYADHYPHTRSRAAFAYWLSQLRHTLRRADLVISVSEFAKREILAFCERYGINPPPIWVTYEGVMGEETPAMPGDKQNYVMALVSKQPHKQSIRLLELWRKYEQEQKDDLQLRLVGSLPDEAVRLVRHCQRVSSAGFLDAIRLRECLGGARALLLPSEVEGFGLPAIESVYAGTPVVFVKHTSVEEILGPAARAGFDLLDYASFAAAMQVVLKISTQEMAQDMAWIRERYNWQAVAERTLAAYRQVRRAAEI
ncbi:MAG: glycosyltransferase [Verrucomicrobiales bacterium]|nr:glycosyltransferase [Verrucomicrobiales bacterium]